jgi:branched-chain amino acid transport system ATP-binding protein
VSADTNADAGTGAASDSPSESGASTANDAEPLLAIEDIQTYYGESHVIEGVSLDVQEGEVVALVGRNGVGKTTTLRSVLQLTPPREGSIRYHGEECIGRRTHEVTGEGIGWIPEERRVFSQLTVAENVSIAAPADGDIERALSTAYETFPDLERFSERKAGTLSGGQQQMLAIARGLVGDNDLLLVDEPSEGLAPQIVGTVAEALADVAADTTVLLVEQNLPLALDLADRFYVLDNGQVVASGDTDDVSADDDALRGYLSA